jgi:para-nitrobenzyl esterase
VYAYFFKWDGQDGSVFQYILGASHVMETAFFFGLPTDPFGGFGFNPVTDTPGRQALSQTMMDYVDQFVRTGNPNGEDLPEWETWSNAENESKVIVLDANENEPEIIMITEEITAQRVEDTFWNSVAELEALQPGLSEYLWWFHWF